MNVRNARRTSLALSCVLALAAPVAMASGSGGSTTPTTMPSQSVPNFDPAAEYRKGIDALKAEKYEDAQESFSRVLQSNPRDANTHLMMGLALGGQGKLADARPHFEKAVRYNDDLIIAHTELGVTYSKLGQTDKAKAVLDDLRKRAAKCGDSCAQAKDLQSGVSALESELAPAASPASPASPSAPASPASPASPPTAQVPAARELLDASIASGDQAYLHAVALINEKRYEDAIAALHDSARVFGPHPDILTYLGYANRKLGRLDIADYRQALAAAPHHLGATEYYGELMVVRGDLGGARKMLVKLENECRFGCAQADELRRWVVAGKPPSS